MYLFATEILLLQNEQKKRNLQLSPRGAQVAPSPRRPSKRELKVATVCLCYGFCLCYGVCRVYCVVLVGTLSLTHRLTLNVKQSAEEAAAGCTKSQFLSSSKGARAAHSRRWPSPVPQTSRSGRRCLPCSRGITYLFSANGGCVALRSAMSRKCVSESE